MTDTKHTPTPRSEDDMKTKYIVWWRGAHSTIVPNTIFTGEADGQLYHATFAGAKRYLINRFALHIKELRKAKDQWSIAKAEDL